MAIEIEEGMAQEEFKRILKAARVKWDLYQRVQGTRDADNERAIIVDAIMEGRVTVDAEGWPTVVTGSDTLPEVRISRRGCRADWLMVDRVKDGHNVAAQDAVIGAFIGKPPSELQKLESQDYQLIQALWWIFLGYRV